MQLDEHFNSNRRRGTYHGYIGCTIQEAHGGPQERNLLVATRWSLEGKLGDNQLIAFVSPSSEIRKIYAHLVVGEPVVGVLDM